MEFPKLTIWRHLGPKTWTSEITGRDARVPRAEVYDLQIAHFVQVIRGEAKPMIAGREGQKTLAATLAISEAARTGQTVRP